ncbi:MAG: hypothetical protein ABIT01_01585 [Thermoanaerobaculia bacterium]
MTPFKRTPRPTLALPALAFAAASLLAASSGHAQTPTPTPSPTPIPASTLVPATSTYYGVLNGGRYDSANLVLDADGSIWSASANENVILKLSADGTKSTRWTMTKDAAPSSLLKLPDGTIWLTELGGFNVARFNPSTGELVEWADTSRRPTALAHKGDGTFWLPETNGALANFNPASGTFTYYKGEGIATLSYPWLDPDGSVFSCDFINGSIVRFSRDGTSATRWALPSRSAVPSKIIRGFDGALWIGFYNTGQLARFDPLLNEIKIYQLSFGSAPFDLVNYKNRILYSEQRSGFIGFFDPATTKPSNVVTLSPDQITVTVSSQTAAPATTTLTPVIDDVPFPAPLGVSGLRDLSGLAELAAGNGAVYGLAVDERRGRIYFGTSGNIGTLTPPTAIGPEDQYFPSAASVGGAGGARWQSQIVTWNRGVPVGTPTPAARPLVLTERLLPSGWIAGFSPAAELTVGPNQLSSQDDPIGNELKAPDSFGALRLAPDGATSTTSDLFSWGRVSYSRPDGGTYGFAQNGIKAAQAISAPESAFLFTPPDAATQRTNAGVFVLESSRGAVSIVDAEGQTRSTFPYDWPSGYHIQGSTIFQALSIEALPSARVVFRVDTGRIFPFAVSLDAATNDPIGLDVFPAKRQSSSQSILGAARGGGPMGPTSRTDLQLYNSGSADALVSISFRASRALGAEGPPSGNPIGFVTVPPNKVVTLTDVIGAKLGLDGVIGTLDLTSDKSVFAFARVTASPAAGGHYGFGIAGQILDSAISAPLRGVFLAATDNGYNLFHSDLHLTNLADAPTAVTLRFTTSDGVVAATREVTLPARETRSIEDVWYSSTGFGASVGRVDVIPADGSGPIFATLLRQDRRTGDTDALLPFVIPR